MHLTTSNGSFSKNRKEQAKFWLDETIASLIKLNFYNHPQVKDALKSIEKSVIEGSISPFAAARKLISLYKN